MKAPQPVPVWVIQARTVLRRCGSHSCPPAGCHGDDERLVRRFSVDAEPEALAAPPIVEEVLRSSGRPLDEATRSVMEASLGHDFSMVRIHDHERAGASALAVHALAYTVGADVVFAPGRFAPASSAGRRLLAHELAHTVQQEGAHSPGAITVGLSDAPEEAQAYAAAGYLRGSSLQAERKPTLRRQEVPRQEEAGEEEWPCAGWERDIESFAIAIARHYMRTEVDPSHNAMVEKVDHPPNHKNAGVWFDDGVRVTAGWPKAGCVLADQYQPTRLPRHFYDYDCDASGRITFTSRSGPC